MRAALALVAMTAPSWADRAVTVELDDHAPFTSADLTAALRVRVDPIGDPIRVTVHTTSDGVSVEARGRTRDVTLSELSGAAAARMVALVAGDLLLDDLSSAPIEPSAPHRDRVTIGVLGGGAIWSSVLAGGSIDVVIPRGNKIVTIDLGGGQLVGHDLALTSAIVRLGLGVRVDRIELRAGATLAPISVSDGDGDLTMLVGGGASARLRLAVVDGARFVLAAGADLFATKTDYHIGGMTVSTPWFAPWVAIGAELTP